MTAHHTGTAKKSSGATAIFCIKIRSSCCPSSARCAHPAHVVKGQVRYETGRHPVAPLMAATMMRAPVRRRRQRRFAFKPRPTPVPCTELSRPIECSTASRVSRATAKRSRSHPETQRFLSLCDPKLVCTESNKDPRLGGRVNIRG